MATWNLPETHPAYNRSLYIYKGESVSIDGERVGSGNVVELYSKESASIVNGSEEGCFLFLQGKPIGEPVVTYEPFVTNTNAELQDVMRRYQRTQFGGWPWPKNDQVHEKGKDRFAIHSDGKIEEKD